MVSAFTASVDEIPSAYRPGRRFQPTDERLLDDDLRVLAAHLPGAREGLILSVEVPGPRGVADLVAITRAHSSLRERLDARLPFLDSVTDCEVVSATAVQRTLTAAVIARSLGMSDEQVQRRLRALARTGHVRAVGTGYRRSPAMMAVGNAYALEAKVNDWRQGISQALRYSSWCDAAGVVLLTTPRNLGEAKARCQSFGIGLAVKSRWIVRPRISQPKPGLRLWLSEQVARNASLAQNPSPSA